MSDIGRSRRRIKHEIKEILEESLHDGGNQHGFVCDGYQFKKLAEEEVTRERRGRWVKHDCSLKSSGECLKD